MNGMWTFFRSLTAGDYFQSLKDGEWYIKIQPLIAQDNQTVNAVCLTTGQIERFYLTDLVIHLEKVNFEAEFTVF